MRYIPSEKGKGLSETYFHNRFKDIDVQIVVREVVRDGNKMKEIEVGELKRDTSVSKGSSDSAPSPSRNASNSMIPSMYKDVNDLKNALRNSVVKQYILGDIDNADDYTDWNYNTEKLKFHLIDIAKELGAKPSTKFAGKGQGAQTSYYYVLNGVEVRFSEHTPGHNREFDSNIVVNDAVIETELVKCKF